VPLSALEYSGVDFRRFLVVADMAMRANGSAGNTELGQTCFFRKDYLGDLRVTTVWHDAWTVPTVLGNCTIMF
jgi:hypothetical protein